MTIKLSVGLRNMLVYFATRPGYISLYKGGPPPRVDLPPLSTLLFTPIAMLQGASDGGGLKLNNSTTAVAIASGTISWGRIVETFSPTAEVDASATAVADFTIGLFGSGADLVLPKTDVVTGDLLNLSLNIHYPAI